MAVTFLGFKSCDCMLDVEMFQACITVNFTLHNVHQKTHIACKERIHQFNLVNMLQSMLCMLQGVASMLQSMLDMLQSMLSTLQSVAGMLQNMLQTLKSA